MHFVEAKSILSASNGMNIYRGCTHGCIYCDSRSECYQMNHDFEDIEVKRNAPELLNAALRSKRQRCMISTGSMCDPYMRCESELMLTRRCIELIDGYGFGLALLTKSAGLLRDIDLFKSINSKTKCVIEMTLTTADDSLCKKIEPHVSVTSRRASALEIISANGIPTVAWLSPFLPFINDTEENLRELLKMCFNAGVCGIVCFGAGLTLREGNREYFYSRLDESFPGMKEKYIETYGDSYECLSPKNKYLMDIFRDECKSRGVMCDPNEIFAYMRSFEEKNAPEQLSLF